MTKAMPFRSAYRCSDAGLSRMLLTLGASAAMQDKVHLNTPLHWACQAKNRGVIALLAKRAHVHAGMRNAKGQTPVDIMDLHDQKEENRHTLLISKVSEKLDQYNQQ